MNITKLDIEQVVDGYLANHQEAIETAIEEDRVAGLTNKQSKAIAACVVEIRKEIQRQGAIYDQEEKAAIQFITDKHGEIKDAQKTCLEIVKGLQKNWDDRQVVVLRTLVNQMATAVEEIKQLKKDLTGHQGFRNKFCNVNECTRLLGQRNYNELNKIYLDFRKGPLKEYAALGGQDQEGFRAPEAGRTVPLNAAQFADGDRDADRGAASRIERGREADP